MRDELEPQGWDALRAPADTVEAADPLARAFASCFRDPAGPAVLEYLRRAFLDRRVAPTSSDAELRHVEGQRSVVAHILALIDRGRA